MRKNGLTQLVLAAALAAGIGIARPAKAQEPPVVAPPVAAAFSTGYNALENGITDAGQHNARLYFDGRLGLGKLEIGLNGLHEMRAGDTSTYWGRNVLTVGAKEGKVTPIISLDSNSSGFTEAKVGLRTAELSKLLGGYGWLDATTGKDGSEVILFHGQPLGKGSLEVFQKTKFPKGAPTCHWTELQGNYDLGKHVAAFGRMEFGDFEPNHATYVVGVTLKK